MSYFVRREDLMTGAVTRSGPFETEQEAVWALQNAADMDCEADPEIVGENKEYAMPYATHCVKKELVNSDGDPLYMFSIEKEYPGLRL